MKHRAFAMAMILLFLSIFGGTAAAKTEKKTTLSSTAMESLRRAMGNYLKGGKEQEAAALAQRYGSRMTAMQKKQLKKLFGTYGANLII